MRFEHERVEDGNLRLPCAATGKPSGCQYGGLCEKVKGVPLDGSPHYSFCGRYRAQRNHKVYRTGITEQTDSNTMFLSQRPGETIDRSPLLLISLQA